MDWAMDWIFSAGDHLPDGREQQFSFRCQMGPAVVPPQQGQAKLTFNGADNMAGTDWV